MPDEIRKLEETERRLIRLARSWLLENTTEPHVRRASDTEVKREAHMRYPGGWEGFKKDFLSEASDERLWS